MDACPVLACHVVADFAGHCGNRGSPNQTGYPCLPEDPVLQLFLQRSYSPKMPEMWFTVLILSLFCRVVCIFACSCKLSFCILTDGSAAALDMLPPSLLCQCLCSTLRQAAQSGQTFCFALLAYINNWQVYFYLSIWACVCVRACVFPYFSCLSVVYTNCLGCTCRTSLLSGEYAEMYQVMQ